jgi:hypothetical protein
MPTSSLERARSRIRGDAAVEVVEAAAGCGKTHEAVGAAEVMARQLAGGQEVLLLTHTNSARSVFTERLAAAGARARMQTIDSLALEIVQRYAPHLKLTQPVEPGATHRGHPTFEQVRAHAVALLRDAPAVAEGLAFRHPVILVDEHQDSTADQHALAAAIASCPGVRIRYFGDRLQAIYGYAGGGEAWDSLCAEHEPVELNVGHRWAKNPPLRDWLLDVRAALLAGEPIDLRERPACVTVHEWSGQAPAPRQPGYCPGVLHAFGALDLPERSAVLIGDGAHGYGLVEKLGKATGMTLYEGSDTSEARAWLERAMDAEGDPAQLSLLLGRVMNAWGSGFPPSELRKLKAICTSTGIQTGRHQTILPLIDACRPIYEQATVTAWLRALRHVLAHHAAIGWRPIRRDPARLLYATAEDTDDPLTALQAAARVRATRSRPSHRAVMTIHRAKGAEFGTVVLPYVSASHFSDSHEDAKRLYVALTRAQSTLHLMLCRDDPSPRFRL